MDKIIDLTKELKEQISSLPVYKEFLKNKEILENNEELQRKREEIAKNLNNSKLHDQLLNEYNSHPLVVNYNTSREELNATLITIKNILN